MKIGVRAHDFGRREIGEMAGLLHDEEYEAAQLALPKAFMGIESYDDITPEKLEQIRTSLKSRISILQFLAAIWIWAIRMKMFAGMLWIR